MILIIINIFIKDLNWESAKNILYIIIKEQARWEENILLENVINIIKSIIRNKSKREQITNIKTKNKRIINILKNIT